MSKNNTNITKIADIDELDKLFKTEQQKAHELKEKFDADLQKLYDDFREAKKLIRQKKDEIWEQMKAVKVNKKIEKLEAKKAEAESKEDKAAA